MPALALLALAPAVAAQSADSGQADSRANLAVNDGGDLFGLVPARFMLSLGGYLPQVSTRGQLSTQFLRGTDINFENRLGLTPNTQTLNGGVSWRISKRNYLAFQYFTFGRGSTKQIADSIIWGDNVYHAGATLDVHNQVQYYGLSYRYYIWRERNWEVGPGLGIDALTLSSTIGIDVAASDSGRAGSDSAKKEAGLAAPVPLLGIYGDWEFYPRILLKGTAQYVYINDIGGIGGYLTDDALGVEWYPFLHFGLGATYHFVGADITRTYSSGDKLNFVYVIQGPAIYIAATF